jgi:hypothetical protein
MALPVTFSLLHSELNDFLYAPLGEENGGGVPLSVLSALTRLDVDPWAEAARLAALPSDAAVDALMSLIGRFPREHQTPAQIRKTAGDLAALLPIRVSPAAPPSAQRRRPPGLWLVGLVLAVVLVLIVVGLSGSAPWR